MYDENGKYTRDKPGAIDVVSDWMKMDEIGLNTTLKIVISISFRSTYVLFLPLTRANR